MTDTTMNFFALGQEINAAELTDFTDIKTGGGTKRLLPSGTAFVRLTSYIEYGNHPQEFKGKAKDPALEFRLGFHVVGGVGVNLEGVEEDFVQDGHCPMISTWDTAASQYAKSKAVALFNAVNVAPKTATHFIQKLGQLYTINIGVGKNKTTNKDQNVIDFTSLQPAVDSATRRPYTSYLNAAENTVPLAEIDPKEAQVFLWNKPSSLTTEQYQAMWDSIYIDGEYEAKVDEKTGKVTPARSKNFLQLKCQAALNYEGSSLQQLIGGVRLDSLEASPNGDDSADATTGVEPEPAPAEVATIDVPDA